MAILPAWNPPFNFPNPSGARGSSPDRKAEPRLGNLVGALKTTAARRSHQYEERT